MIKGGLRSLEKSAKTLQDTGTKKAYRVCDKEYYMPYVTIVFAETRGKAIAQVLHTDEFEDYEFTELSARRAKWADKYYRGEPEMDWDNPHDRFAMVHDGGFICDEDSFDPDECKKCCAFQICEKYREYEEECEDQLNWDYRAHENIF